MAKICSRCGTAIHDEVNTTCYNCLRIENKHKRFGQRRPFKWQISPPLRQSAPPPAKKQAATKKAEEKTAVAPTTDSRKRQRKAINQLLSDLYDSPRHLSDILRDGRLTSQQIARLKEKYLPRFLDALVMSIATNRGER